MLTTLFFFALQKSTLSLESPGITVKALVQKMSEITGQAMEAPDMADREVIVRYNNVKLQDAMEALAQAEVGTWVKSGEKLIFRPDPNRADALYQAWLGVRADRYRKSLALLKNLVGPPDYTVDFVKQEAAAIVEPEKRQNGVEDFIKTQTLGYALPGGRMLVRCMNAIGPERLASLMPGEKYFFTGTPTSLQFPLEGASDILDAYKQEQPLWVTNSDPYFPGHRRDFTVDSSASAANAQSFLLGFHGGYRTSLGVSDLMICDSTGKIISEMVCPLLIDNKEERKAETDAQRQLDNLKVYAEVPPITEQIMREKGPWTPDSQFREVILHPDKYNIPALGPGTAILASAKALNVNLMVPFHDRAIVGWADFWNDHKLKAAMVLRYLTDPAVPERPKDDGWIVVRPEANNLHQLSDPAMSMAGLAEFAQEVDREHEVKLERYAEQRAIAGSYSKITDPEVEAQHSWILSLQGQALLKGVDNLKGAGWIEDNYDPIELYGKIPEATRILASQGPVPISGLPAECQNALYHELQARKLARTNLPNEGRGTIWCQPSIFFASTAALGGTLKIDEENYDTYEWKSPETNVWREAYPPKPTPLQEAVNQVVNGQVIGKEISAAPDRFRAVHGKKIRLTFQWPTAYFKVTLTCDDQVGRVTSRLEDLPEAFGGGEKQN